MTFCCEGCCPRLNVSGAPEVTDYYEDYPAVYVLVEDTFNGQRLYRKLEGEDEFGQDIYGVGYIYYWADIGWLLGANLFTYSYYSDGKDDKCPQFAPEWWINNVFGTQVHVECIPVYPSCNDVECNKNAACVMRDDGPVCECSQEYVLQEDGQCQKEEFEGIFTAIACGDCDIDGYEWTDWMNSDTPDGYGDWETLAGFPKMDVCGNPTGIQAMRTDFSMNELFYHIDIDMGFWCINSEQTNGNTCADYKVRFCCPKWQDGECTRENFGWTPWKDRDDPDMSGDWETLNYYSDGDVCSSPIAVVAQLRYGDLATGNYTGSTAVTHIDRNEGFWCLNEEQDGEDCADFMVSFCCPQPYLDDMNMTWIMDGTCDDESYEWTDWFNSDVNPYVNGELQTTRQAAQWGQTLVPSLQDAYKGLWSKGRGFGSIGNTINPDPDGTCPCGWELVVLFFGDTCLFVFTCFDEPIPYNHTNPHGDWEVLGKFSRLDVCDNPSAIQARAIIPVGADGFTMGSTAVVHINKHSGFWCLNEEQPDGYDCADFEVRFCCPKFKTAECDAPGHTWTGWYNDEWSRKNYHDPSSRIWVSDKFEFEVLQPWGDSGACSVPTASEVRVRPTGSTSFYNTMVSYARLLRDELTPTYYACYNDNQEPAGKCVDMEIRYCCPSYGVITRSFKIGNFRAFL